MLSPCKGLVPRLLAVFSLITVKSRTRNMPAAAHAQDSPCAAAGGDGRRERVRSPKRRAKGVNTLRHRKTLTGMGIGFVAALAIAIGLTTASASSPSEPPSTTPIKHLIVIFGENISFDHYFGTYPNATNPPGEPAFTPLPGTPSVNGLSGVLLSDNPNSANPERLDRSEAVTCDQDHAYGAEQQAADAGLMDKFVQFTAGGGCANKSIV